MPKPRPSRAIASAALALALAYLLLPAGFVSHGHDDGSSDGHDHDCVICCLHDQSGLARAVTPVPAAPVPLAPAAASACQGRGLGAALGPGLTRGPPA